MSIAEKLTKVAENEPKVYKAGQKSEYDRFWNSFQNNGNRSNYASTFYNEGWNDVSYNPKYNINMLNGNNCFSYSSITDTKVDIDASRATTNITNLFLSCAKLRTIKKLIVSENTSYTNVFMNCSALEEIRFDGTIGKSLDIHWSTKLSVESYRSIFEHMSIAVTGQTITFPTTAKATFDAECGDGQWDLWVSALGNWTFAYA